MPPSLLPFGSNAQRYWASSISTPKRSLGISPSLLVCRSWLFYNQEKKSKKRKEEKDQDKDQRVDHNPGFVHIRRVIVLEEKRSISKRAIPNWSWVDTHIGWILAWLRKNLLFFRSRFKKKLRVCDSITYLISTKNSAYVQFQYIK